MKILRFIILGLIVYYCNYLHAAQEVQAFGDKKNIAVLPFYNDNGGTYIPKSKPNLTKEFEIPKPRKSADIVSGIFLGLAFDGPFLFDSYNLGREIYSSISVIFRLADKKKIGPYSYSLTWHSLELQAGVILVDFFENGILHSLRKTENKKTSIHYKWMFFPYFYVGCHYKYYTAIKNLRIGREWDEYGDSGYQYRNSKEFYTVGVEAGLNFIFLNVGLVVEYQSVVDEIKFTMAYTVPIIPIFNFGYFK